MTTAPSADRRRVQFSSAAGIGAGGIVFLLSLLDFQLDLIRTATRPGYWSGLYDIQARALMDGKLAVPTGSLGIEGIVHDGATYMYFPPFPALLRLPVLMTTNEYDGRLTLLSMAVAGILYAVFVVRLTWLARRLVTGREEVTRTDASLAAVFIAAMLGGTVLTYDVGQPWVYHEAYVWAAALAVGALYWLVRVLDLPTPTSIRWLALFCLLCVLTRATEGWAICVVTMGVALWIARGQILPGQARLWWQVLLAGALPLVVGIVLSEIKFDSFYMHPLSEQVWTTVNAHRREALAANGGSLTGPQFFTTSLWAYFRPDGIRFVEYFPWITFPALPVVARGSAFIDQSYRTGSVTAFMPLLLLSTVVATIATFRPGASRGLKVFRPALLAGVLVTGGVMAYGYYAYRYATDFVPALVVGGAITCALLSGFLHGRRLRVAAPVVGTAAVLTLWSLVANLAVGHSSAAFVHTGPPLVRYVENQVWLSGSRLADKVSTVQAAPTGGSTDDLAILGDCSVLFLNTGDAYRTWATVAQRDLSVRLSPAGTSHKGASTLWRTSAGPQGSIDVETDGTGRMRLVTSHPARPTTRSRWQVVPTTGVTVRLRNLVDLELYELSTSPGGKAGYMESQWHGDDWVFHASVLEAEPTENLLALGLQTTPVDTPRPAVCRKVARLLP